MINKNKLIMIAVTLALLLAGTCQSIAQCTPAEAIEKIYERIDTLNYLTFDVNYIYKTDTVNGDYENSALSGTFTLAENKAFYNLGDIQFMQNDSFLITVYSKDKIMIVSDPHNESGLPFRSEIDSLLNSYSQNYNITTYTDSTDSAVGVISFVKADSLAQYDLFLIKYDTLNNYINSIEYDFAANDLIEPDDSLQNEQVVTHQKKFIARFSNYRIANFSEKIYDESNYIWFEKGKCMPAEKYKGFRIFYSKSRVKRNTNSLEVS